MKKKCQNCKWFEKYNFWGHSECWRNHKYYEAEDKGKIYQDFVGRLERDVERNKNNDCPFYKRIWWKIF